jgi:hypothetical protein
MQFTDDPAVATLEAHYATYLEAWGAWTVGHHAGIPATRDAALGSALIRARSVLGSSIAEGRWLDLDAADAAAVGNLRACLPELDAWAAPLDGRTFPDAPGPAEPGPEPDDLAALRRATFDAWGAAMASLRVGNENLDRLTVMGRQAREPDPAQRRRLFLAMEPAWRTLNADDGVDSPYRRLLRASAERWARDGSPIDANASALGLAPSDVEPTMRALLATFRAVALRGDLVEPWDYRFVVGELARRLDDRIPLDRLRPINDAHLRSIGADPTVLRVHYDIVPRAGRPVIPTAFTVTADIARRLDGGTWRPATPWVFATYAQGGIGNLEELLHESGHALHYAAIRARPAHFAWPPEQTAFVEAVADVVGWTTHEPAFLEAHLGVVVPVRESVAARYGNVALDAAWTLFEIELHRHPERSPNEVWAEIAERELGVRGHPEWAWWATRGQLIDGPGYLANYALGAVMVAAVRARIRELRGDWATGDPGWYAFVSDRLLRPGGAASPRELLTAFLDGPLTAGPLLDDIARAA